MANGTLIAKGEVVTVNGRFGIRVVEVVATKAAARGTSAANDDDRAISSSCSSWCRWSGAGLGALWLWRKVQPGMACGRRERLVNLVDATPLGATGRSRWSISGQAAAARGLPDRRRQLMSEPAPGRADTCDVDV